MLQPGDQAPDFTLMDQSDREFSLSASLAQHQARHLLFFYPKADTPGCTAQACGLRDVADRIGNTVVIGLSPDSPTRQARFDAKYALGFGLLADQDHAVASAYGAWGTKSMYGKSYEGIIRSAFLINADGRVAHAWYKVSPKDTAANLLASLAD
ncbi:MAG: thioredoxin-dependent thiol peroxidase [Acidimicrobiales bacterium]